MVNQGARGTLKSDVSKIAKRVGIKIKKKTPDKRTIPVELR